MTGYVLLTRPQALTTPRCFGLKTLKFLIKHMLKNLPKNYILLIACLKSKSDFMSRRDFLTLFHLAIPVAIRNINITIDYQFLSVFISGLFASQTPNPCV